MNVARTFRQASRIMKEEGASELLLRSIAFVYAKTLRPILPKTGVYTTAGVPTANRRLLDPYIPRLNLTNNPEHEYALVSQLKEYAREGDDIVVIGAGSGTTSVVAAKEVGPTGSVIAYEGSADAVEVTKRTFSLNDLQDRCEVRHAIVGEAIRLAGATEATDSVAEIHPRDLPECDVLELDCEGAERVILSEMDITPRVIIVETHPTLGSSPDVILGILEEKGYEFQNRIDRGDVPVLTILRNECG